GDDRFRIRRRRGRGGQSLAGHAAGASRFSSSDAMISLRQLTLISLAAACAALSGCSTVSRLNPFNRGGDEENSIASQGERIPVIALDQSLKPADALKGVDFYLPSPVTMQSWPLPGGNLEQAVGHVEAAPNLSVAWKKRFGEGSKRGYQVTAPPVA